MKTNLLILLAAVWCSCALADNTGTVTMVKSTQGTPNRYTITWTAGTNNDSVSARTENYVRGELLRAVFEPTNPTGDYDAALSDGYGVAILSATALSSNTVAAAFPGAPITDGAYTNIVPIALNDQVLVAVTNCGNEATGKIILYLR